MIRLPLDPSDEELTRDWTLSTEDFEQVRRCRGDEKRHSFALQLCTLRRHGRYLGDYGLVPDLLARIRDALSPGICRAIDELLTRKEHRSELLRSRMRTSSRAAPTTSTRPAQRREPERPPFLAAGARTDEELAATGRWREGVL